MGNKVQQNIILENGGTIWLPPNPDFVNTSIPDLSKPDSSQAYDISTAYTYNGKAYYYAYTTGAVTSRRAALSTYPQALAERVLGADADIYASSIVLTVANPDGPALNGTLPANYLKGGSVLIWIDYSIPDSDDDFHRGIISHPVLSSPGKVTVELDSPIPKAITTAASYACAIASPYASIHTSGGAINLGIAGVPACYAAAGRWVWIQTWGQCAISAEAEPGIAGERAVNFRANGALDTHTHAVSGDNTNQHAGYVLFVGAGGTQGAPFIYLQMAHP